MFLDDITLTNLKNLRICKVNSGGNDIRALNVWVGHVRNDVLYNLRIAYCYCNRYFCRPYVKFVDTAKYYPKMRNLRTFFNAVIKKKHQLPYWLYFINLIEQTGHFPTEAAGTIYCYLFHLFTTSLNIVVNWFAMVSEENLS